MSNLAIEMTDLEYLIAKGSATEIELLAKRAFAEGSQVSILQSYANAPSDLIHRFSTVGEFQVFWDKVPHISK